MRVYAIKSTMWEDKPYLTLHEDDGDCFDWVWTDDRLDAAVFLTKNKAFKVLGKFTDRAKVVSWEVK